MKDMAAPAKLAPVQALDGRGMVAAETNSVRQLSEDTEKMARRRFHNPKPKRVGNWWYLLIRQDEFIAGKRVRKKKRIKLAPATMGAREVNKIAADVLRPLNQGLIPLAAAVGFEEYLETTYQTTVLPLMAKSTQVRSLSVIQNHLKPAFGSRLMRDLTPLSLQQYFSVIAMSPLSYESRDKIRDVLSSILASAVSYGILVKNPIEGVKLGGVHVAAFTGLRPSELIGLRWRNVHSDSITIEEKYCRGEWGAPKSKASNATIPVNPSVIERIYRLKGITVEIRSGECDSALPGCEGVWA